MPPSSARRMRSARPAGTGFQGVAPLTSTALLGDLGDVQFHPDLADSDQDLGP